MNSLQIDLPDSFRSQDQELAAREGISPEDFARLAIAEKMASLRTVDYLRQRASLGSREKVEAILRRVPDVEPEEQDKL